MWYLTRITEFLWKCPESFHLQSLQSFQPSTLLKAHRNAKVIPLWATKFSRLKIGLFISCLFKFKWKCHLILSWCGQTSSYNCHLSSHQPSLSIQYKWTIPNTLQFLAHSTSLSNASDFIRVDFSISLIPVAAVLSIFKCQPISFCLFYTPIVCPELLATDAR